MKIKKILIVIAAVLLNLSLYCQSNVTGWEYAYDNAGNRISRTVIYMTVNRSASDSTDNNFEYYTELSPEDENPDSLSLKMKAGDISVSIFPNPVQEYININVKTTDLDGDIGRVSYQLIDLNGRVIVGDEFTAPATTINFGGIANGSYILRIFANEISKEYKIIKK